MYSRRPERVAAAEKPVAPAGRQQMVEAVTENGNSRFIGALRKKHRICARCSGRNSALRLLTPRKTFSRALWCIHHRTTKVQVPNWFGAAPGQGDDQGGK